MKDLEGGKRIKVKDVVELSAIEGHIRQAAQTFKEVLADRFQRIDELALKENSTT